MATKKDKAAARAASVVGLPGTATTALVKTGSFARAAGYDKAADNAMLVRTVVKLSTEEQMYIRPDTFIGAVEPVTLVRYVVPSFEEVQVAVAQEARAKAMQEAKRKAAAKDDRGGGGDADAEGDSDGDDDGKDDDDGVSDAGMDVEADEDSGDNDTGNTIVAQPLPETADGVGPAAKTVLAGLPKFFVKREVTTSMALEKAFQEVLSNAMDACSKSIRNAVDGVGDGRTATSIAVTIDAARGALSVWNDGPTIPVAIHPLFDEYVPVVVTGEMCTSTNYNDKEDRYTCGRNGYGAKCANVFATEFTVECNDTFRGKSLKQTYRNNMKERDATVVAEPKAASDYTLISWRPDMARFRGEVKASGRGPQEVPLTEDASGAAAVGEGGGAGEGAQVAQAEPGGFDADTVAALQKRVYDAAGTLASCGIKVSLNGHVVPMGGSFKNYVAMYRLPGKVAYMWVNRDWEVAVGVSPSGVFWHTAFVNGILTSEGGTHVAAVADQVASGIAELVNNKRDRKKEGATRTTVLQVKQHMAVFVNCKVPNPTFGNQTKDALTSPISAGTVKLDAAFVRRAGNTGLIERALKWARLADAAKLKRLTTKAGGASGTGPRRVGHAIVGLPKLDDALWAGTAKASQCTLILTEGDSAKALAVSGLSVVGRQTYGVYPLRGKVINVRNATLTAVANNGEMTALVTILGLEYDRVYTDASPLRYGHVLIMSDQDSDGSHIRGLIINLFHTFWPSLLKLRGFLSLFITPIVKCVRGGTVKTFFTMPSYEAWAASAQGAGGGGGGKWTVKYYKGLGTSSSVEAKEYFRALDTHHITMEYDVGEGVTDDALTLAFDKKRSAARKQWLQAMPRGVCVDYSTGCLTFKDFVDLELVLYAETSNMRAIPCVVDGLKLAERKVVYGIRLRPPVEYKVEQLVGYISERTSYHHGGASVAAVIIRMAQTFVGSNNVNLLYPSGQFGTRLMGGSDAASSRYIFTKQSVIMRYIFRVEDDPILEYLRGDDGKTIEPRWFLPVVPLALVNGCAGIGVGWATNVPPHNPLDVIAALRAKLVALTASSAGTAGQGTFTASKGRKGVKKGDGTGAGANTEGGAAGAAGAGESGSGPVPGSGRLVPWYRGFKGVVQVHTGTGAVWTVGSATVNPGKNTVTIDELYVGCWNEKFKGRLESMRPAAMKAILEAAAKKAEQQAERQAVLAARKVASLESAAQKRVQNASKKHARVLVHLDKVAKKVASDGDKVATVVRKLDGLFGTSSDDGDAKRVPRTLVQAIQSLVSILSDVKAALDMDTSTDDAALALDEAKRSVGKVACKCEAAAGLAAEHLKEDNPVIGLSKACLARAVEAKAVCEQAIAAIAARAAVATGGAGGDAMADGGQEAAGAGAGAAGSVDNAGAGAAPAPAAAKKHIGPVGLLHSYVDESTETRVRFQVQLLPGVAREHLDTQQKVVDAFKLRKAMTVTRALFTPTGDLHEYNNPEDILEAYFPVRMDGYVRRRLYLIKTLRQEETRLDNLVRFTTMVVNKEIVIAGRPKADVVSDLKALKFASMVDDDAADGSGSVSVDGDGGIAAAPPASKGKRGGTGAGAASATGVNGSSMTRGYDYLLSRSLASLTKEEVEALRAKRAAKADQRSRLEESTPAQLWLADLAELESVLLSEYVAECGDACATPGVAMYAPGKVEWLHGNSAAASRKRAKGKSLDAFVEQADGGGAEGDGVPVADVDAEAKAEAGPVKKKGTGGGDDIGKGRSVGNGKGGGAAKRVSGGKGTAPAPKVDAGKAKDGSVSKAFIGQQSEESAGRVDGGVGGIASKAAAAAKVRVFAPAPAPAVVSAHSPAPQTSTVPPSAMPSAQKASIWDAILKPASPPGVPVSAVSVKKRVLEHSSIDGGGVDESGASVVGIGGTTGSDVIGGADGVKKRRSSSKP